MNTERRSTPPTGDAAFRVLSAGKERWSDLQVDGARLGRYLKDRSISNEALSLSLACDLFLAFACFDSVPGAVQAFQLTFDPIIVATARRFDASGGMKEELRQRMAELLFVGTSQRPPRIADYTGRGPLSAWVRTCAKRAALRLAKIDNPESLMTRDALADEISDVCDQELALLKEHYGELFRQELVGALSDLPPRDRMLLQLHLVAGLSTTRIGTMFHLSQSSISRQLQRAAATIFSLIKQRVHARLGVETAELESLLDLARSHIELTLSSMNELLLDEAEREKSK